ncbi:hypothetical protein [Dongia sp.]|uniref:hypothetical protein n=1 Tax=Dongia sp. TaxID=1977262 RepID=UPI003753A39C
MTVSSTINREQYATNGITPAFTIHFPFFNDTDVNAVFVDALGNATPLALNADFSVTGGGGTGGSLIATVPPAAGGTLTLYREIPFTQEDDYVEDDPLPADTLEGGFDRAVMRDQQLKDGQDRALTFPVTIAAGVSAVLPNPSGGRLLGWSADGLALENKDVALQGAVTNATEAQAGIARIATQALVDGGTNDTDFVTARKLANSALAATLAANTALLAQLQIATRLAQFTLSR